MVECSDPRGYHNRSAIHIYTVFSPLFHSYGQYTRGVFFWDAANPAAFLSPQPNRGTIGLPQLQQNLRMMTSAGQELAAVLPRHADLRYVDFV